MPSNPRWRPRTSRARGISSRSLARWPASVNGRSPTSPERRGRVPAAGAARDRARIRGLPIELDLHLEPRAGPSQPAPVRRRPGAPGVRYLVGRWHIQHRRHRGGHEPHRGGPRRRGPDRALDVDDGYTGTSLNRLDPASRTWCQTWVDDQGDVVEFVDGPLRRRRDAVRRPSRRRGSAADILPPGPGRDPQLSEQSEDGGATWSVEYDLRYRRVGEPRATTPPETTSARG